MRFENGGACCKAARLAAGWVQAARARSVTVSGSRATVSSPDQCFSLTTLHYAMQQFIKFKFSFRNDGLDVKLAKT